MATFQDAGFLGDEWRQFRDNIRAKHADAFDLADRVNALAMKELWALPMTNLDEARAYGVTSFARAVQNYQTAIILCERGAEAEARTLVRAVAETVFLVYGCFRKPNMVQMLYADNAKHRKGHANAMIQIGRRRGLDVKSHEEDLAKIAAEYPNGPDAINWSGLAGEMDLAAIYELAYRPTSGDAAHATLDALHRHLTLDAEGNLESFDFNPRDTDVRQTLKIGMACMTKLFELANNDLGMEQFEGELRDVLLYWQLFALNEQAQQRRQG